MTLPTEDVAALVAFANEMACYFEKRPTGGEDSAHWSNVANAETSRKIATALSTLAGERDATIANYHELNKVSLEVISERDDALRKAAFWEKFSGVLQDDADKFKARALASEARATALEGERDAEREQAESFKAMYHQACEWRDVKITALEAQLARAREDTIAECISVIERVGNWGDYKRDELTKDFGQPRFDMWTEIVEALRSIPAPADGRGDQMFASPSCPQEPVKDETAWLVEMKGSTPSWAVCFAGDYDDHWTTDSTKALRFARKADAEAFIAWNGWTEAFASEHMWDDARTALLAGTPPSGAETQEKVDGN